MSTTINISVLVINHRADQRLVHCLQSVNWADQVVVIDYGSEADWKTINPDGTIEVIEQNQLLQDFSQARNEALQHARHEWVLFLDSDEEVDQKSIPLIKELLTKNSYDAVSIIRQDYFLGKPLQYGEAGHQEIIRLGKKASLQFIKPVHEVAMVDGRIYQSGILIHHYAHQSIAEFFESIVGYAEHQAKHTIKQGETFSPIKMMVWPIGKCVWNLVIKRGIFDGWRGIVYATMMSCHSFFVRVFMYELTR